MTQTTDTRIRTNRFKMAKEGEKRFTEYIEQQGCLVCSVGQETHIPPEIHQQIRRIYDDTTITYVRHKPDLFVLTPKNNAFLVDVKTTSEKYWDSNNFCIETASLETCQSIMEMGVNVLIVFEKRPSEFYAQWANQLDGTKFDFNETKFSRGSGTPFTLIEKTEAKPFTEILHEIEEGEEET